MKDSTPLTSPSAWAELYLHTNNIQAMIPEHENKYNYTIIKHCFRQNKAHNRYGVEPAVYGKHGEYNVAQLPTRVRAQRRDVHVHDTEPRPVWARATRVWRLGSRRGELHTGGDRDSLALFSIMSVKVRFNKYSPKRGYCAHTINRVLYLKSEIGKFYMSCKGK